MAYSSYLPFHFSIPSKPFILCLTSLFVPSKENDKEIVLVSITSDYTYPHPSL